MSDKVTFFGVEPLRVMTSLGTIEVSALTSILETKMFRMLSMPPTVDSLKRNMSSLERGETSSSVSPHANGEAHGDPNGEPNGEPNGWFISLSSIKRMHEE